MMSSRTMVDLDPKSPRGYSSNGGNRLWIVLRFVLIYLIFIAAAMGVQGQENDPSGESELEKELSYLRAEAFVITASKTPEEMNKSAATISVIGAKEIRDMGARDLADVLRTVPGIGISRNSVGYTEVEVRGVKTNSSEKVLFMINSQPINDIMFGTAMFLINDINLDNVQRIEVIRGPGSALYGANAFLAVVNIITRQADEIEGVELSVTAGGHDTARANLLFGRQFGGLDLALNANFLDTDGFEGFVPADAQTQNDAAHNTNASLAPGYTNYWRERSDLQLNITMGDFQLQSRHVRKKTGPYIGINFALNRDTVIENNGDFTDLRYEKEIGERTSFSAKIYRNNTYYHPFYEAFPDGFAVVFTDGFVGELESKNTKTGLELQGIFEHGERGKLIFGATGEREEQYDVRYRTNFNPLTLAPFGELRDVTEIANWNRDVDRDFWAVFIEEIWDVRDDMRLTVGSRYDRYSDFGGSFNPRLGLSWELNQTFLLKMLYGEAFRAPANIELYTTNNPALGSNPNLKPEKVHTSELGIGARLGVGWRAWLTVFHNNVDDLISPSAPDANNRREYSNSNGIESTGIELDVRGTFSKGHYLAFNFTYQDPKVTLITTEATAEHAEVRITRRREGSPDQKANLLANFRLSDRFNFNTSIFHRGSVPRALGSVLAETPSYTMANLTLLGKDLLPGLEVRASVYNVTDEDYANPSQSDSIPGDYPEDGRTFNVELKYVF